MRSSEATALADRHPALVARLHRRSCCQAWGLDERGFARTLERVARHRFGDLFAEAPELESYLESLHLEDLALVAACLDGRDAAWEHLVSVYRRDLRQASRAIAGESGVEIADSIFAELYGLDELDGERRSLLRYFHGRSRLSTWLRTVLAQRHIDRVRAARRLEPLDEAMLEARADAGEDRYRADPPEPATERYVAAFRSALTKAVSALDPRQRQRLAWYYSHRLTLAEIGRLLGEHEATVSRKLERARRDLRSSVESTLRQRYHYSDAEVARCLELGLTPAEADIGRFFAAAEPVPSADASPARPSRGPSAAGRASPSQG